MLPHGDIPSAGTPPTRNGSCNMLRLKVFDGQDKINEIQLGTDVVTLGRDETNRLMLPDLSVSRAHAQIEPTGNFHLIRDTGSTNGTFVNDILVRVHVLNAGDTVRLGKYLARVESLGSTSGDTTRVRVEKLRLAEEAFELELAPNAHAEKEQATADDSLALDSLRRLYELGRQIAHIDTRSALLERAVQIAVEELAACSCSLLLVEDAPVNVETEAAATRAVGRFRPAAVHLPARESRNGTEEASVGPDATSVSDGDDLVIPSEIVAQVLMHKAGLSGQLPAGEHKRPFLVCPLQEPRGIRGLLFVERRSDDPAFSTLELRFLQAITDQFVTCLANAELFEKVSQQSAKVETIVANLGDGVLVTDDHQRILEANSAAMSLLGINDRNPVGTYLFDLFVDFQTNPETSVLETSACGEGAFFYLRPRNEENSDSVARLISGRLTPFPKNADKPLGVVVTLRDRSREQHVEELKIVFLEKVAHKLRSPLTVIQGNLELLRAEPVSEDPVVSDTLQELERSTSHLGALVEEFVDFMELRTRTNPLVSLPRRTPLHPIVREAIRATENLAQSREARVENRLEEDLPSLVTQPELLGRALTEVVENAIKFGRDGGLVFIDAQTADGYLRLDVTDDGPGIPAERIDSVFYVCHQIDAEQTGQVPGVGLGLTIARQIVQEHGGEIEIVSPVLEGGGTRVSLFLPLTETTTSSRGARQSAPVATDPTPEGATVPGGEQAEIEKEATL